MSLNKVLLVGNLGKDPEVQIFESGAKKAAFSLATSERYTNREGQRIELTEWHNVVCWGKLADIAEKWLQKGKMVYVEGKIKTRSWEEDGKKRYITEIEANNFQMLGAKPDNDNRESNSNQESYSKPSSDSQQQAADKDKGDTPGVQDDDLPF